MKRDLRYGGSTCDSREERVIIKSVRQSIKSGNWQTGEQAKLLEEEAAKFLGVKHGVLTTSGSCAGLLALTALELPRGSEVIIPAVTFPTIFNIIIQCGLVPVVVDAKVGTYNLDVPELAKAITSRTRAIVAVHAVGNPVDMPALMKMVRRINKTRKDKIYVIEDNCDGWGSTIQGKKVGSFGDVSITSFHAAHIVSMGVGGGVFAKDAELAKRVRMYRDWGRQADTTAKSTHKGLPKDYNPRFIYEKIGYNFQILELQAAMGRVQLKKAGQIMRARKRNFNYLAEHLSKYGLIMPISPKGADVCWFALPLTVKGNDRGELVKHLEKNGIETRSLFSGDITKHPAYKDTHYVVRSSLKGAKEILHRSFWLTVHPRLKKSDLEYIVKTFDDYFA
jgi:CDP-6-deoxy-D-xylo-4-hexulose-3-dehydrase